MWQANGDNWRSLRKLMMKSRISCYLMPTLIKLIDICYNSYGQELFTKAYMHTWWSQFDCHWNTTPYMLHHAWKPEVILHKYSHKLRKQSKVHESPCEPLSFWYSSSVLNISSKQPQLQPGFFGNRPAPALRMPKSLWQSLLFSTLKFSFF